MVRFLSKIVTICAFSMPLTAFAVEQQAALVLPQALVIESKGLCDKGVAVFKIRNDSHPWKAMALVSFVADKGDVLFQRALRMTKNQTMSYRLKHHTEVSGVRVLVDYPGLARVDHSLGQPCA